MEGIYEFDQTCFVFTLDMLQLFVYFLPCPQVNMLMSACLQNAQSGKMNISASQ